MSPEEFYADALAAARDSETTTELEQALDNKYQQRRCELEQSFVETRRRAPLDTETGLAAHESANHGSLSSFARLGAGIVFGWDQVQAGDVAVNLDYLDWKGGDDATDMTITQIDPLYHLGELMREDDALGHGLCSERSRVVEFPGGSGTLEDDEHVAKRPQGVLVSYTTAVEDKANGSQTRERVESSREPTSHCSWNNDTPFEQDVALLLGGGISTPLSSSEAGPSKSEDNSSTSEVAAAPVLASPTATPPSGVPSASLHASGSPSSSAIVSETNHSGIKDPRPPIIKRPRSTKKRPEADAAGNTVLTANVSGTMPSETPPRGKKRCGSEDAGGRRRKRKVLG